MNLIHQKIWSERLGAYVAVAENTRSCGKSSGVSGTLLAAVLLSATGMTLAASPASNTLPTGGQVVAGQAAISQSGNALTITQSSNKAAINWQSFSVGSDSKVNFVQPSAQAVALNRVLGADVSVIQGSINANGQVFLVNPNGVLFTPTAQVNVGALVGSTQNISTTDFMAGNYKFSGKSAASVENQGRITAANGGAVALIAARVVNSGQITANAGQVALAAANTVTLDLGGPVLLRVSEGALEAAIEQNGGIRSDGGTIYLTAQAAAKLAASVINHSGVTQAQTLADVTGSINLSADIVSHTGQLDASSATGRGGSIAVNAGTLIDAGATTVSAAQGAGTITQTAQSLYQAMAARLSADSREGQGGSISMLGDAATGGLAWMSGQVSATGVQGGDISASANKLVVAGFQADSSGTAQAGRIRLGGGWQGKDDSLSNAQTVRVGDNVALINHGAGGRVVVWSDQQTSFGGHIDAPQGAVEVSGKENLSYSGTTQSASLLLDPKNITIESERLVLDVTTFDDVGMVDKILTLKNGNEVLASSLASPTGVGSEAGAVWMFAPRGVLISTLTGGYSADEISSGGIIPVGDGNNFVVVSPNWFMGGGAVTWVDGSTGLNGAVSPANSLTGINSNKSVGSGGVTVLTNGNYVVSSPKWHDNISNVLKDGYGAVTWGSGTAGVKGRPNASNSLVGSTDGDAVGSGGVTALDNGGYVVLSPKWGTERGAVTWVANAAASGASGAVSPGNSLTGAFFTPPANFPQQYTGDRVGSGGLIKLSNGKYLISSPGTNALPIAGVGIDDSLVQTSAGALTWVDPNVGVTGVIGSTNSLVGRYLNDKLGSGGVVEVGAPGSGSFVISSPKGQIGTTTQKRLVLEGDRYVYKYYESPNETGAVTFVNGSTGLGGTGAMVGNLSASNSSYATGNASMAAGQGVTVLANGNYVALSGKGATWGSGSTGVSGEIDASNTLLIVDDVNETRVFPLSNGNYVVTNGWYGAVRGVGGLGAVAWGDGTRGVSGVVSLSNALIGEKKGDSIGSGGVVEVGYGNYVVSSPNWNNNKGATTWSSGTAGLAGRISSSNSLMGGEYGRTEAPVVLSNGNYVVNAPSWANYRGAVTWGSGATGVSGEISESNSLIGGDTKDSLGAPPVIGGRGIVALTNGNYLVLSPTSVESPSVTWADGTKGIKGVVSSANSLMGARVWGNKDPNLGVNVVELTNGNFVMKSGGGGYSGPELVIWVNGKTGITGQQTANNALLLAGKNISIKALSNGNYVILNPDWGDKAGAVTWLDGNSPISGQPTGTSPYYRVDSSNSLVGDGNFSGLGFDFHEVGTPGSGNFVVSAPGRQGAVTWVDGSKGLTGVVSAENSLVGREGFFDNVGKNNLGASGVTVLSNGNYVVHSGFFDEGAVSWGDGNKGVRGELNESNSIFGGAEPWQKLQNARVVEIDGKAWVKGVGSLAYRINGKAVVKPSDTVESATFGNKPKDNSSITPTVLKAMLDNGTDVTLQANNDITLKDALSVNNVNGRGGKLTLLAGRNININAALTTDNGDFTAIAGTKNTAAVAEEKKSGFPTLTIGPAGSIDAGTGVVTLSTAMWFDSQNTSNSTFTAALTNVFMPTFAVGEGPQGTYIWLSGQKPDGKRFGTTFDEATGKITCLHMFSTCQMPTQGFNVFSEAYAFVKVKPIPNQVIPYGYGVNKDYTLEGFLFGDTASTAGVSGTALIGSPGALGSNAGQYKVGSYDLMYRGGLISTDGYLFTDDGDQKGELTVVPRTLEFKGLALAANKPYDGKTSAKLISSNAGSNVLKGDLVKLETSKASGNFVDKTVGQNKIVAINGLTISGADASNYILPEFVVTTANIYPPDDPKYTPPPPGNVPAGPPATPTQPNKNPGNQDPNVPPDDKKKKPAP